MDEYTENYDMALHGMDALNIAGISNTIDNAVSIFLFILTK